LGFVFTVPPGEISDSIKSTVKSPGSAMNTLLLGSGVPFGSMTANPSSGW